MAGYFEEMGWEPLRDGETPNNFLQVARFLLEFQYVDPETPLAPAASKEAVAALPEISISEEGPSSMKNGHSKVKERLATFFKKINILNTKTINPKGGGACTVCLKHWKLNDLVKEMPCKHTFHPQCIMPWLEKTNSCPLCRHELPTDDPDYEESKKRKQRAIQREKEIEILHDSMFS